VLRIDRISLNDRERDGIGTYLSAEAYQSGLNIYSGEFATTALTHASTFRDALSPPMSYAIDDFKDSSSHIQIFSNIPSDETLEPTPSQKFSPKMKGGRMSEWLLSSVGFQLGVPFAIEHENYGRLVHNLYPIQVDANQQKSTSSSVLLTAHTELSCIDTPPDYLALVGLRSGSERVSTLIYNLDDMLQSLEEKEIEILQQLRFITEIDESLRGVEGIDIYTKPFSIVTMSGNDITWRYDVEYTRGIDAESSKVVARLAQLLEEVAHHLYIGEGDLAVIKNTKVAHGRTAFKAKYDGSDRWLQRLNVLEDSSRSLFTSEELFNKKEEVV